MKKLLIWIMAILLISSAYALNFEKSTEVDLKIPCENDGKPCSSSATCNITIKYPNSSFLIEYKEMTNQNNGDFNITLNENQTNVLGEYAYSVYCSDGGYHGAYHSNYMITPTGQEINTGQGITTIGLILAMILLSFVFAFFGHKFSESERLFPIALFFMLISLILGVYVIQLGYIFSRDILFPLSISSMQFHIWLGVMYSLIFIAIIGFVFFTAKALKLLKIRKKEKEENSGYGL